MCYRTAAAQQLERSRVLNSGIAILLIPPILVLAGILLLAFRKSGAARKYRAMSQVGSRSEGENAVGLSQAGLPDTES